MKLDYLLLLLPGLSDGVLLSGREGHSVGEEEVVSTCEWPLLEATLCMVNFELQEVCNRSECCSLRGESFSWCDKRMTSCRFTPFAVRRKIQIRLDLILTTR